MIPRNWIYVIFVCLFCKSVTAGELYTFDKLQLHAAAFIDTYQDLIKNQSNDTNTEMLLLSSEYKGYISGYLDFQQRGEDLSESLVQQCMLHVTLEEIVLNVAYLLVDVTPMENISATENLNLIIQGFCSRRILIS